MHIGMKVCLIWMEEEVVNEDVEKKRVVLDMEGQDSCLGEMSVGVVLDDGVDEQLEGGGGLAVLQSVCEEDGGQSLHVGSVDLVLLVHQQVQKPVLLHQLQHKLTLIPSGQHSAQTQSAPHHVVLHHLLNVILHDLHPPFRQYLPLLRQYLPLL